MSIVLLFRFKQEGLSKNVSLNKNMPAKSQCKNCKNIPKMQQNKDPVIKLNKTVLRLMQKPHRGSHMHTKHPPLSCMTAAAVTGKGCTERKHRGHPRKPTYYLHHTCAISPRLLTLIIMWIYGQPSAYLSRREQSITQGKAGRWRTDNNARSARAIAMAAPESFRPPRPYMFSPHRAL